jgi:hypothetical protein
VLLPHLSRLGDSLCKAARTWGSHHHHQQQQQQRRQQQQEPTLAAQGSEGGSTMDTSGTVTPHADSSSSSSQGKSSAVLLAVLLARSVVVLADAMDAAAATAGITPAQLYARWVKLLFTQQLPDFCLLGVCKLLQTQVPTASLVRSKVCLH